MASVLGIDAAWTERNASGYALVDNDNGRWRLRLAAPDLRSFAQACGLRGAAAQGATPALACAENAAEPFGDADSAIWIPKETWTTVH